MKGNLVIGSVPRKHCPRSAEEAGAAIHAGESGRAYRVNGSVVGLKKLLFSRGERSVEALNCHAIVLRTIARTAWDDRDSVRNWKCRYSKWNFQF